MAIEFERRYATRNEEIIAKLRAEAGAGPPIDPHMKVKRLVAELSTAMALIHGGHWSVDISHHGRFIVIAHDGY